MNEEKKLSDILKEYTDVRNLNTLKLAELSGVPERYITALTAGDFSSLPPEPYIRGYLLKMAAVFEVSGSELWQTYKKEIAPQSSGALDRLPSNRFIIQPLSKKWAMIALAVLIVGAYLVLKLPSILGQPTLNLSSYSEDKTHTVATAVIVLSGSIKAGDTLTLNSETVYADPKGNFEKEIMLQKGLNTEEFVVSRFLGRTKKVTRQFNYEPVESKGAIPQNPSFTPN